MANVKINDLAVIADPASTDVLPIVDVTLDTTNKISIADILKTAPEGTAAAPAIAFEGDSNTGIYHPGSEQIAFSTSGVGRVFIASDGNIGVGTASPDRLLHLTSENNTIIRLENSNTSLTSDDLIGSVEFEKQDASGEGVGVVGGMEMRAEGSLGQSTYLNFSTSSSTLNNQERLRIDSDGLVGIGTTNPGYALEVSRSSPTFNRVAQFNSDSTVSLIAFGGSNGTGENAPEIGQNNSALVFNTQNETRAFISADGKFGIGTSSPDELLHIEGNVAEFKGTNTNPIEVSAGTEQIFKFGIEGQKNNVYGPAGSIIFRQDGTWSSVEPNFKPTRIELCTQDDATTDTSETPRLVVDQDGYVGIGTTSPQSLFDVVSPNSNTTETIAEFGNQTIAGGLQIETNGNLDWGFNARNSRNLTFSTNQDEAARIDSSGRLLVGTSNPIATPASLGFAGLQVASTGTASSATNSRFSNNAAAPFYEFAKSRGTSVGTQAVVGENDQLGTIVFAGSSGSAFVESARIRAQVDADPDPNDDGQAENGMPGRLVFSTTGSGASSPTERMRITSTGRVGIDATDPQAALDINAAASTSPFIASIDGSEAARIDSSGRLLVGTSSSLGNVGGAEPVLQIADNSVNAAFCFARFTTNSSGPSVILAKAKSATIGTFTSVQDSDELGKVVFAGADGTNATSIGAEIKAVARPTIATGSIPTRLEIGLTKSGETSPTGRIRLEPTGNSKFYVDSGNIFEIRRGGTSSTQEAISLYNGSTGFNTGSLAFTVRGDGDCENANNAYTGISDVKLKENIVDAESQWDDIRALRVRKYNLKGELGYSTHTQIGLVAQEVELISPGLVGEGTDIDGEGNDLGTVTKSVNYSVLYMKAVKALQEAMERIETLEQRLTDAGI